MVITQRVPIYNRKERFCFLISSSELLNLVKSFGIPMDFSSSYFF